MIVNNLEIPQEFSSLLEKYGWDTFSTKLKNAISRVSNSVYHEEYKVLSIEGMGLVTENYRDLSISEGRIIYGLNLLNDSNENESNSIDINQTVIFAVNRDEEAICFNYQNSHDFPQILETNWTEDGHCKWLKIADSFGDLFSDPSLE